MFKSKFAAVLCLALCLAACQSARNAQVDDPASSTYSDWQYHNFTDKQGKLIHSAFTATRNPSANKDNSLSVFYQAENCGAPVLLVTLNDIEKPFAKALVSQTMQAEVRVDDNAAIQATYTYKTEAGKGRAFLDFSGLMGRDGFTDQLLAGQLIRFKAKVEGTPYAVSFTLRNINPFLSKARSNCVESAAFQGAPQGSPGKGPARPGAQGAAGADDEDKKFFK